MKSPRLRMRFITSCHVAYLANWPICDSSGYASPLSLDPLRAPHPASSQVSTEKLVVQVADNLAGAERIYRRFKNREVAGKQPRSYYQDGHDEVPFHSGIVVTTPNVSNWTKPPSTGSKEARNNLNYLTSPPPMVFIFLSGSL